MAARRLAAILAADVVGYSRLMAADEKQQLLAVAERDAELLQVGLGQLRQNLLIDWVGFERLGVAFQPPAPAAKPQCPQRLTGFLRLVAAASPSALSPAAPG